MPLETLQRFWAHPVRAFFQRAFAGELPY
ncbi:hypothetical protein ACLB1T_05160 [Escherichia coli]